MNVSVERYKRKKNVRVMDIDKLAAAVEAKSSLTQGDKVKLQIRRRN